MPRLPFIIASTLNAVSMRYRTHIVGSLRSSVTTALLAGLLVSVAPAKSQTLDFNQDWRFKRGDESNAETSGFDDADWEVVRTPHDWAINGPFDPRQHGYAGKLPWQGVAWYRKTFAIGEQAPDSRFYLDFDGVMACPTVYVNGELAGEWDYGYTPFRIDLTSYLRIGHENVVAVRVDTTKHGTRWYPGAGIYRKVSLTISPPLHLAKDGATINVSQITSTRAAVQLQDEIESHLANDVTATITFAILSPSGEPVARRCVRVETNPGEVATASATIEIEKPERWDLNSPSLYTATSTLLVDGYEAEHRETRFGIRTIELTPDDGLLLNGKRTPIHGVNLHHDLGPLGAAFNRRAAEHRLEILQEMGVNAIRTAHNPPARELLDLCDERGLLVWDELFDKWDATSDRPPSVAFKPYFDRHAAAMVRRDRNHPCVFLWSIGNEIIEAPSDPQGLTREKVAHARQAILDHDATRPVGLSCHIPHAADSGVLDVLDVTGWNYQARYERARSRYPQKPIIYSESSSAVSTRGDYRLPLSGTKCEFPNANVVSAYEFSSPCWGDVPEVEFERLRRDSYLLGEFVWTGFDYLGEPTPFDRTARSSFFGIMDLVGLPKDRFYLYRSLWRPDLTTIKLSPHWNWAGHEGEPIPVIVYTNGDSAELFLNGRSMGFRHKKDPPPIATDLAKESPVEVGVLDGPLQRDAGVDWCAVEIGPERHVSAVVVDFSRESKYYGYRVESSGGDGNWRVVARHTASNDPPWGGVFEEVHRVDVTASKFRIVFENCLEGVEHQVEGIRVYANEYESPYYLPTYDYRLRWNDVPYAPGELRVEAYKNGVRIGEHTVRTAGTPSDIELYSDRTQLSSSGEDLAYVTIAAIDESGEPCPLAEDEIQIEVVGAGKLLAVGNGDPTSMASFHDSKIALFGGKAVAIIQADEGGGGDVFITASSDRLGKRRLDLRSKRMAE